MTVVFLDRDGVINYNRQDYVRTVDDFEFIPGALEGLAKLKEAGITVIVISNQAGVGRGLIDPAELQRINVKMLETVMEHGGEIAGVYYCIHRKDEGCDCRKPGIGLLQRASADMDFPLEGTYFVGDAESDIEAGCKAGCTTVFVLTGRTSAEQVQSWNRTPDFTASDFPAAVDYILTHKE